MLVFLTKKKKEQFWFHSSGLFFLLCHSEPILEQLIKNPRRVFHNSPKALRCVMVSFSQSLVCSVFLFHLFRFSFLRNLNLVIANLIFYFIISLPSNPKFFFVMVCEKHVYNYIWILCYFICFVLSFENLGPV